MPQSLTLSHWTNPCGQEASVSGTVWEISLLPAHHAGQRSIRNRPMGIMENIQLCEIKLKLRSDIKLAIEKIKATFRPRELLPIIERTPRNERCSKWSNRTGWSTWPINRKDFMTCLFSRYFKIFWAWLQCPFQNPRSLQVSPAGPCLFYSLITYLRDIWLEVEPILSLASWHHN